MNREIATSGATIYPLTGDVKSTAGSAPISVVGIQGIPVQQVFPVAGEVLTYDGPSNTLILEAPAQQIELETNSVANGSQALLNLIAGTNVTITDGGSGGITIAATGGVTGITRGAITTNANGSYYTWSDGLIEQWGFITLTSTGNDYNAGTITFPIGFPTALQTIQVTTDGLPNSGNANDIAAITAFSASVIGAGVQLQCSVPTGGGGTTFNQSVKVYWYARGI